MPERTLSPTIAVLKPLLLTAGVCVVVCFVGQGPVALAQESGLYTDPETGIVYRKVQKTVERPVYETQVRTQESTTYRPET